MNDTRLSIAPDERHKRKQTSAPLWLWFDENWYKNIRWAPNIVYSSVLLCWYCDCCYYWSLSYSDILCSRADSLRSCRTWFWLNDCILLQTVFVLFFKERNSRKWCTDSSIWLLNGWCHMKLLLSRRTFCVHHTTMHQCIESLHSKPHTYVACVFSCNLPYALLAEWPGSFTCYCS